MFLLVYFLFKKKKKHIAATNTRTVEHEIVPTSNMATFNYQGILPQEKREKLTATSFHKTLKPKNSLLRVLSNAPSRRVLVRTMEDMQNDKNAFDNPSNALPSPPQALSKNAKKKLLKQQRFEAKKAEKKAQEKQQKREEAERKRKEWEETLAGVPEEERSRLIESRRSLRKERMEKRSEERERKIERLTRARELGQKIVVDLDFAHLMTPSEIHSLVQQVFFFLKCLYFYSLELLLL
jgi:hypothetical protein